MNSRASLLAALILTAGPVLGEDNEPAGYATGAGAHSPDNATDTVLWVASPSDPGPETPPAGRSLAWLRSYLSEN